MNEFRPSLRHGGLTQSSLWRMVPRITLSIRICQFGRIIIR